MNFEQISRQKRTLSNQLLLCGTLKKNKAMVTQVCDAGIAWLKDVAGTYNADGLADFDSELTDYLVESGYFRWKQGDGVLPTLSASVNNQRNWKPMASKINAEIEFIIASMSPFSRRIALSIEDGPIADITNTVLYKCQMLNYLNRKICIMAENLGESQIAKNDLENTTLFNIFNYAQRVRSSTFDTRAADESGNAEGDTTAKFMKDLKKRYRELSSGPDRPFNPAIHRQRTRGRIAAQADERLMSIDAGGITTTVKDESTFGRIARQIGLPERCDISGTTTDAVGAAMIWAYLAGADPQNNKPQRPDRGNWYATYVLCCVTAMELIGHHTLSEMIAAASLWSEQNYGPFAAKSPTEVLNNLLRHDGQRSADGDVEDLDDIRWITRKWQTLRLNPAIPVDLTFDDRLWNTARYVVS